MNEVLVSAGAASIILAVVGGGAKAFGVEVPLIASISRQVALALVGVAFLVAAVVLRDEGEGPTGPSEEVREYREDVLTACNSLSFGSLPAQPSYQRDEIRDAWRSDIRTYRGVFNDLWRDPAPESLRPQVRQARSTATTALSRMEQVFTRIGSELPPTVDQPTLQSAWASAARELSQPLTRLEARMSRLAGRDCGLVGS